MIQDIAPDRLDNAFANRIPRTEDHILLFDPEGKMYVKVRDGVLYFPTVEDLPVMENSPTGKGIPAGETVYLFSVNDTGFFLAPPDVPLSLPGFEYRTIRELRDLGWGKEVFAAFTAYHLWRWYADNRHCGRCGGMNGFHPAERALQCNACGHVIYPRINPAVIVGVIRDNSLLITRYRTGYAHNALVAGFTEIGESLEQTVAREVMEETGVRVRNIRYYKSQPWGIAQDLLMGFFCEADGSGEIRMDESELKYAEWVGREDIVLQPNNLSLTNEMMMQFKLGHQPPAIGKR